MAFCTQCGAGLSAESKFCHSCGAQKVEAPNKQSATEAQKPDKAAQAAKNDAVKESSKASSNTQKTEPVSKPQPPSSASLQPQPKKNKALLFIAAGLVGAGVVAWGAINVLGNLGAKVNDNFNQIAGEINTATDTASKAVDGTTTTSPENVEISVEALTKDLAGTSAERESAIEKLVKYSDDGNNEASFALGQHYLSRGMYNRAIKYVSAAKSGGIQKTEAVLGEAYRQKFLSTRETSDLKSAFNNFQMAKTYDADARCKAGLMTLPMGTGFGGENWREDVEEFVNEAPSRDRLSVIFKDYWVADTAKRLGRSDLGPNASSREIFKSAQQGSTYCAPYIAFTSLATLYDEDVEDFSDMFDEDEIDFDAGLDLDLSVGYITYEDHFDDWGSEENSLKYFGISRNDKMAPSLVALKNMTINAAREGDGWSIPLVMLGYEAEYGQKTMSIGLDAITGVIKIAGDDIDSFDEDDLSISQTFELAKLMENTGQKAKDLHKDALYKMEFWNNKCQNLRGEYFSAARDTCEDILENSQSYGSLSGLEDIVDEFTD